MRKAIIMIWAAAIVAPALAQPAALDQSPRQKYDYWMRCAAMFQIKVREANGAGNTPESSLWDIRVRSAVNNGLSVLDLGLKDAVEASLARADAERTVADRAGQFSETLAQGNKETDAQFERAVEICSASLMPDAH